MTKFEEKWDIDRRIEEERKSLVESAKAYKESHEDTEVWEEKEVIEAFTLTDEMITDVKHKFLREMKQELLNVSQNLLDDRTMLLNSSNLTETTKDTLKEDIKEYEIEKNILENKIKSLEQELTEEPHHGR